MNDIEYMTEAFKGDIDAVRLVMDIVEIAGTWDDLIDRDKPVSGKKISRAFTLCLVSLPDNPFYQRHANTLLPVIVTSIVNYHIANHYESEPDVEGHALAHVLRYSVADVISFICFLIGGMEWAQQWGPELRRRSQKDTISHYLSEMAEKQAATLENEEKENASS